MSLKLKYRCLLGSDIAESFSVALKGLKHCQRLSGNLIEVLEIPERLRRFWRVSGNSKESLKFPESLQHFPRFLCTVLELLKVEYCRERKVRTINC
jgi:hypothetical protein